MRRAFIFVLIASLAFLGIAGCSDSDDPSIALPPSRAVNGTFAGPLPDPIPGEDWSTTTMELETSGNVSGTITPKSGVARPVGGTFAGTNLVLSVGNLSQQDACFEITMNVFRFEFDSANNVTAFEGTLTARCQAAVSGGFRMEQK